MVTARYLLAKGANVNARSSMGQTPTAMTIVYGENNPIIMLHYMLQNGGDLHAVDNNGNGLLGWYPQNYLLFIIIMLHYIQTI